MFSRLGRKKDGGLKKGTPTDNVPYDPSEEETKLLSECDEILKKITIMEKETKQMIERSEMITGGASSVVDSINEELFKKGKSSKTPKPPPVFKKIDKTLWHNKVIEQAREELQQLIENNLGGRPISDESTESEEEEEKKPKRHVIPPAPRESQKTAIKRDNGKLKPKEVHKLLKKNPKITTTAAGPDGDSTAFEVNVDDNGDLHFKGYDNFTEDQKESVPSFLKEANEGLRRLTKVGPKVSQDPKTEYIPEFKLPNFQSNAQSFKRISLNELNKLKSGGKSKVNKLGDVILPNSVERDSSAGKNTQSKQGTNVNMKNNESNTSTKVLLPDKQNTKKTTTTIPTGGPQAVPKTTSKTLAGKPTAKQGTTSKKLNSQPAPPQTLESLCQLTTKNISSKSNTKPTSKPSVSARGPNSKSNVLEKKQPAKFEPNSKVSAKPISKNTSSKITPTNKATEKSTPPKKAMTKPQSKPPLKENKTTPSIPNQNEPMRKKLPRSGTRLSNIISEDESSSESDSTIKSSSSPFDNGKTFSYY